MGVQNMRTVVIDASVDDYAGAINEASGLIASATGTFAAAYAAGTATVTLNGFSASKLLTAGSHIVVPGHAGYYTLSGDITATAGGVLADVVLLPSTGLQKAVASGAAVDVSHNIFNIDGLETADSYPAGLQFTIAGDATVYTTLEAVTTSSTAGDFRVSPGLVVAVADNAVVTFRPPELSDVGADQRGLLTFSVSGIAGGTVLTPEGTIDGTTWAGVGVTPATSTTIASTMNADGMYRMDASGLRSTRLRVSTAGTGSVTVKVTATARL
jgi:hypothetical protein